MREKPSLPLLAMRANWLWLIGLTVGIGLAQPRYKVFFRQAYVPATGPTAPDSVDIYVLIDSASFYSIPDTLASSNFPFFYNPLALDMSGARVIYMNRFSAVSKPNYYDPINWSYTYGRVNVTVRRKLGYSGAGDEIREQVDTLLGLRVPLLACGPPLKSILIWDSGPAAVLSSQLQNLKPYLQWVGPDTLALCPALSASLSFQSITPSPPRCVGDSVRFEFSLTTGMASPDSFFVQVQRNPAGGGPVQVYPNIVFGSNPYSFSLWFAAADSYRVSIWGAYKKCPGCAVFLKDTGLRVLEPPPVFPIFGPETVYVGGTYTYQLGGGPYATIQWFRLLDLISPIGNGSPVSILFSTPGTDTLVAVYTEFPGSCVQYSFKVVVVKPCPASAQVVARTPRACLGQRGLFEVVNYATSFDSVRWQRWDGTSWVAVPPGPGTTSTLYLTEPLYQGPVIARAVLYYGPCANPTSSDTVQVATTYLNRDFYSMESPTCVGDTSWLEAGGSGVWTSSGAGRFTDTLNPRAGYIPAPSDVGTVQICWVVRSQDLALCRDEIKDTLCLDLTVLPTDADGSFSTDQPPLCLGDISDLLNGQIRVGTTGFWTTDGAGYFSPDPFSNPARYVSTPGDAGRWVHITWNVQGICGRASYTDSLFVQPSATAQIVGPNQICENVLLRLVAQVSGTLDSLLWFRGSVAAVLAAGSPNRGHPRYVGEGTSYETADLSAGRDTFLLAGFSGGGCRSFSELPIIVLASPTASFTADPTLTTMNNPTVQFTSQSQGATIYVWEFGDPNNPTQDSLPNPTFTYSAPGTYTVVLFVQNDLGCSHFYVCPNCVRVLPRKVYLPNAFSPNGDGKNDLFRILPLEERISFTRLEVFDRWGQPIFAGDNLEAWDGRSTSGILLDPGAYTYRALIFLPDEGLVTHTGVVHLTR